MKHTLKTMAVCLLAVVVVTGCAGLGKKMSDEDMIKGTINNLKIALEEKNIDQILTTFSDDFYHPEVGGKEEGKELLQMAIDSGYADNGEVSIEDMEITMKDDGTATVYPIDLSGDPGSISVELVLKKEDAGWLIIEVHPDGM